MDTYSSELPLTLKPQPIGYIIFITGGLVISLPVLSILHRGPSTVVPVLVMLGIIWLSLGIVLVWIGMHKVTVLPEKLVFRQNFSQQELAYKEITQIALEKRGGAGYHTGKGVWYLLTFSLQNAQNPFTFNTKLYSLKDLSRMLSALHACIPEVPYNDLAEQMALGTFSS